ncbi:MAG: hypothetical protein KAS32_21115 [Candidatus Peribacteraceae bacterium]|nr:hypothetical protein [Candidatus Peribacteraceae bacterium]
MEIRVKVSYVGEIDMELDKKIQAEFESYGFKWTGQGVTIANVVRDIGFKREQDGG